MKQLAIAIARGAAGTADEQVMGRPWHISHLRALASHLGLSHNQYVWAKRDPTKPQPIDAGISSD